MTPTEARNLAETAQSLYRDHISIITSTIFLYGTIEDGMADQLAKSLHLLSFVKDEITIYLNSHGGSKTSALGIYDLLRDCPRQIKIIGYGTIASAAVVVLQGGDERLLMSNTEVMIHPGHASMSEETEENLARFGKQALRYRDRFYRILANAMGLELKEMYAKYGHDTWLNAGQSVRLGLADGIV
jgi:ATP-dependent Clp protease protease subunit